MENPATLDPTWKHGSEEHTKREAVPQRPPESTDRKKRHVPQERQWGRRLGKEMFDSYEEFIPLSLLHDDEEEPSQKSGFSGFSMRISMKCYKKLHEITTENTATSLRMSVLQMLQMLQRFFARKRKSGFFGSKEDFAGHATAATIGAHDGQSLLRLRMLCKGYPCQSDYTFWEGYTAENKIMGQDESPDPS